jgi:hypothetical protein
MSVFECRFCTIHINLDVMNADFLIEPVYIAYVASVGYI